MAQAGGAPFDFDAVTGQGSAGAPASPAPRIRHPMGLPHGSVRALLTLMILGIIWTLLAIPRERNVYVPIYLYYLAFLILGNYFAARSATTKEPGREPPPLYLPRGTVRFLVVAGFAAVIAWGIYNDPEFLFHLKLEPPEQPPDQRPPSLPYLPLLIIGTFILGVLVSRISHRLLEGPQGMPAWYADVQAWVALLGMLGLAAEVIVQLVIYPSIDESRRHPLPHWQGFLAAIVSFYFGARS